MVPVQAAGESEICADIETPVRTFVEVCAVPVFARLIFSPGGHVTRLRVDGRVTHRIVAHLASGDVVVRGARARASGARLA